MTGPSWLVKTQLVAAQDLRAGAEAQGQGDHPKRRCRGEEGGAGKNPKGGERHGGQDPRAAQPVLNEKDGGQAVA